MKLTHWIEKRFTASVVIVCFFYFLLQMAYSLTQPMYRDEFGFGRHIFNLLGEVPYRDYSPYKTVLGYYLQLPCYYLTGDLWNRMLLVRVEMAIINTFAFTAAALMLRRHFKPQAIVLGLLLLVCTNAIVETSSSLRVDMLSALGGIFGFLFLIRQRYFVAGCLAALSVFCSQKGAYFVLAGEAAVCGFWLLKDRSRDGFWNIIRFNVGGLVVTAAYAGFFGALAMTGESSATGGVLSEALIGETVLAIAFSNSYNARHFWLLTTMLNPCFYFLGLLAILRLFRTRQNETDGHTTWFIMLYGSALWLCCLWHKQPWPYFLVMLMPTIFVLIVSYFHSQIERKPKLMFGMSKLQLWLIFLLGILLPLGKPALELISFDNRFQAHMVRLGEACLEDGDSYQALFSLLYDRDQAVSDLSWVCQTDTEWLESLTPDEIDRMLAEMDDNSLKIYLFTYQVPFLPAPIQDHLIENYAHMWGNWFVYAPTIYKESKVVNLNFAGSYTVMSELPILVDGISRKDGQRVELAAGEHTVECASSCRLRFEPARLSEIADPRFREPQKYFPYIDIVPEKRPVRETDPPNPFRPWWKLKWDLLDRYFGT